MKILGIDLAGKPTNPRGICLLNNNKIKFKTVYSDDNIVKLTTKLKPDIIAIDIPIMEG